MSKLSTESSLRLAFVNFLGDTANSKAYWYSLEPLLLHDDSPSGIRSFPELIGLSYDSLLHFFKIIRLAKDYGPKHGLKFMPDGFEALLLEYGMKHLAEVTSIQSKQLKGGRSSSTSKHIFIRLGLTNIPAIAKKAGKTDISPPRVGDIRHYRTRFQEAVAIDLKKAYLDNEKEIVSEITDKLSLDFHLGKEGITESTIGVSIAIPNKAISSFLQKSNEQEEQKLVVKNIEDVAIADQVYSISVENEVHPKETGIMGEEPVAAANSKQSSTPAIQSNDVEQGNAIEQNFLQPSASSPTESFCKNIVLNRIYSQLLPLILNDEALNSNTIWKKDLSPEKVEQRLFEIVGTIREERERKVSNIVGTEMFSHSPQTHSNCNTFPVMKAYQILLDDRRVHEALQRELYHMNKKITGRTTIYCNLGDNRDSALVHIPVSSSFLRIKANENATKWFDNMVRALSGGRDLTDTLRDFLLHVSRKPEYQDIFIEAMKQNGLRLIPQLDGITTFAIQSEANLNNRQVNVLRRFFLAVTGSRILSPPAKVKQILGLEYIPVLRGQYKYGSEKIDWMYKSIQAVVGLLLKQMVTEYGDSFAISSADFSISIDHGKGHSRVSLTFITQSFDDKTDYPKENEFMFSIGNARCKKDNAVIIRNTYGPSLNDEINLIKSSRVLSFWRGTNVNNVNDVKVCFGPELSAENNANGNYVCWKTVPICLFMAGDLLWLSTSLGKEGFASQWCPYCDLSMKEWQEKDHKKGAMWTLGKIREHVDKMNAGEIDGSKPGVRRGVREHPLFQIDPKYCINPVLHYTLGAANKTLENLICEMQAAGEHYTDEYYVYERESCKAKQQLAEATIKLTNYNDDVRDHEQSVKYIMRFGKGILRTAAIADWEQIEAERAPLVSEIDEAKGDLEQAKADLKEERSKCKNGKSHGQPVRAEIDDILKRHGIDRGAHFGGELVGNACRQLMAEATDICDDICSFVCGLPTEQRLAGTNIEVKEVCDRHRDLLLCLDGAFSGLRTKRYKLSAITVDDTKFYRDRSMELIRYLRMNIGPKLHCIEDHAVQQMEWLGGIGGLGEDNGEREHQAVAKSDLRLRAIRSYEQKENKKSEEESIKHHPAVAGRIKELHSITGLAENHPRKRAAQDLRNVKRQRRKWNREQAQAREVPAGRMTTLRMVRAQRLSSA